MIASRFSLGPDGRLPEPPDRAGKRRRRASRGRRFSPVSFLVSFIALAIAGASAYAVYLNFFADENHRARVLESLGHTRQLLGEKVNGPGKIVITPAAEGAEAAE